MHIGDVKVKQPREAEEAKKIGSSLFVEQHLFHSESFFEKEEETYETQSRYIHSSRETEVQSAQDSSPSS